MRRNFLGTSMSYTDTFASYPFDLHPARRQTRGANLAGNLARHSDSYYPTLSPFIPRLTTLVETSTSPPLLKFCSFALGNMAFHTSALYPPLLGAVQGLLRATSLGDAKGRANAAGALGNLARNSGECCKEMRVRRVATRLLDMVRDEEEEGSVKSIAYFSLGTLAVWRECRGEILEGGAMEIVGGGKYADRMREKLGKECIA